MPRTLILESPLSASVALGSSTRLDPLPYAERILVGVLADRPLVTVEGAGRPRVIDPDGLSPLSRAPRNVCDLPAHSARILPRAPTRKPVCPCHRSQRADVDPRRDRTRNYRIVRPTCGRTALSLLGSATLAWGFRLGRRSTTIGPFLSGLGDGPRVTSSSSVKRTRSVRCRRPSSSTMDGSPDRTCTTTVRTRHSRATRTHFLRMDGVCSLPSRRIVTMRERASPSVIKTRCIHSP